MTFYVHAWPDCCAFGTILNQSMANFYCEFHLKFFCKSIKQFMRYVKLREKTEWNEVVTYIFLKSKSSFQRELRDKVLFKMRAFWFLIYKGNREIFRLEKLSTIKFLSYGKYSILTIYDLLCPCMSMMV